MVKLIADTADGLDHITVFAEFAPQQLHLPVHRAVISEGIISPDGAEDLVTGHNDPLVADEVKQQMITVAAMMAQKVVAQNIDTTMQDSLVEETLKEMGGSTWQS